MAHDEQEIARTDACPAALGLHIYVPAFHTLRGDTSLPRWVRLNDLPANQTYDEIALPPMLPESSDRDLASLVGDRAVEILALLP